MRWTIAAGVVWGCGSVEREVDERDAAWTERMDEIDAESVKLRDAVVRGDLAAVDGHVRRLRERLPAEGRPPLLDTALEHLEAATTTREAAQAVGELTLGCRACHAQNHASLAMREPSDPKAAVSDVGAEMERHRALVDGMWLTMIGGSREVLQEAVVLLDQGSLTAGAKVERRLAPDLVLGPAARAIDQRVHDLAHQIRDSTWDHRPPLYADLLTTCADCHALARTREALTAAVPERVERMNDHFVDAVRLELGVIGGDQEAARKAAAELAKAKVEAPPAWQPSVGDFTEAAERTSKAEGLEALGAGTAEVFVACGRCHAATGGGPKEPVQPPPGEGTDEMARHLYATYWMGHGLLAPSDEAWAKGAEALATAPLGGGDRETRVHTLAKDGLALKDPVERGKVFGQLLAACSPCHAEAFAR